MTIPELLCPAGSFESFKAAVNNGADAVYFGGRDFNARAGAENFTDDQLVEAIDYAHLRGAKVNITVNTLYRNTEFHRVLNFARQMYESGADAFIVQDLGLFSAIRRHMPQIRIHASTQMTVHSLEGAVFLRELGFDRIVLSRELSLLEIREITKNAGLEIEVFAHGALCVSYSGQCLMSSFIGGRSGNRGKCAGSCRQFYQLQKNGRKVTDGYLLSMKDLMTLSSLKDLAESGVTTLKIEGRMKSPEYVAVVTKAYREQLDRLKSGDFNVPESAVKDVTQIFNRGGDFTGGYFSTYAGLSMMSPKTPKSTGLYLGRVISVSKFPERDGGRKCLVKTETPVVPGDGVEIWSAGSGENSGGYIHEKGDAGAIVTVYVKGPVDAGSKVYKSFDKQLNDRAGKYAALDERTIELDAFIKIVEGEAISLHVEKDGVTAALTGDVAQAANNNPTDKTRILEQISKTGGTTFRLNIRQADIGDGLYIPISAINRLRRDVLEQFACAWRESFRRRLQADLPDIPVKMHDRPSGDRPALCAQVVNEEQLRGAFDEGIRRIYYGIQGYDNSEIYEIVMNYAGQTDFYIALPKIMRAYDRENIKTLLKGLEQSDIRGYVVSSFGQLALARKLSKKEIITDYSFNILNTLSWDFLKEMGADGVTLSTELNLEDLKGLPEGEALVYGHMPLMITAQCPVGLYGGKKTDGRYCALKSRSQQGYTLTDATGAAFAIYTDCESCLAMILNGPALNMQEKLHNFFGTNIKNLRLLFYQEGYDEVRRVSKGFAQALGGIAGKPGGHITYGHYFRGAK